jgi:8-oxo-dGTP pyrophosphatase MutT (NUDIX family)
MSNMERWKPHVTVAAVIAQDGRYLLVEEQTVDGLRLNTPAGHLEPGESPQAGAVREALEETARHFTPESLLGIYLSASRDVQGIETTWLRFAFCGSASDVVPGRSLDTGIVRTLWLTPDEIRASQHRHRSPMVWRCVEDHLAGRRYPLDLVQADASALRAQGTSA